mmetsp:Transcript_11391/g.34372  ORF Transcript_11391/g.34372 Transcript_11391/m.34372 type:complete len:394 (+) Transcript_11391:264-1445(+)
MPAMSAALRLVAGSSATGTSALKHEYISVLLFMPLSSHATVLLLRRAQSSAASLSGADTAWPSVPRRQCSGQTQSAKRPPASSFRAYSSAHARSAGSRARHVPASMSFDVMTVNGSGRADASVARSQNAGCATCAVWCVSSVMTTELILSPFFRKNAAVRAQSSSAPGTASEPPAWKSFCGSMTRRHRPSMRSFPVTRASPPINDAMAGSVGRSDAGCELCFGSLFCACVGRGGAGLKSPRPRGLGRAASFVQPLFEVSLVGGDEVAARLGRSRPALAAPSSRRRRGPRRRAVGPSSKHVREKHCPAFARCRTCSMASLLPTAGGAAAAEKVKAGASPLELKVLLAIRRRRKLHARAARRLVQRRRKTSCSSKSLARKSRKAGLTRNATSHDA